MITVSICRSRGIIRRFSVSGHSGYAERGSDIICAGVSALVQTIVLGLQEHVGLNVDLEVKEGYLACCLPEVAGKKSELAGVLLETMVSGLQRISEQHSDYVTVEECEG